MAAWRRGIGQPLTEHVVYDADGQHLTRDLPWTYGKCRGPIRPALHAVTTNGALAANRWA